MASCCLRARFSRARSRCRLKAEKNAEMQAIKPLIISPTILGASREIQCFLQIRTFGDGQVSFGIHFMMDAETLIDTYPIVIIELTTVIGNRLFPKSPT